MLSGRGERVKMEKSVLRLINDMEKKGFNVIRFKPKIKKVLANENKGFIHSYIIEFQAPNKEPEASQSKTE